MTCDLYPAQILVDDIQEYEMEITKVEQKHSTVAVIGAVGFTNCQNWPKLGFLSGEFGVQYMCDGCPAQRN